MSKSQEPMGDVNVIKKLSKSMPLTAVCYTWHLKKLLRKGKKNIDFYYRKKVVIELKAVIIMKAKPFYRNKLPTHFFKKNI